MGLAFKKPAEQADRYIYDRKLRRFLPYNENLFFAVGQKLPEPDPRGQIWWQRTCHLSEYDSYLETLEGMTDVYLSVNWFWKSNRKAEYVALFDHICIDLDTYKHTVDPSITHWDVGINGENILRFCDENGIPRPSYIIDSGNGTYLHYVFDCPVPAKAKGRLQATHRELLKKFTCWGADTATYDFARVFRLPGSINSKTGKKCRFLNYEGSFYNFSSLCDSILPLKYEDYKEKKQQKEAKKAQAKVEYLARKKTNLTVQDEGHSKGHKGWASWAKKGLEDLKTLAFLRYRGPVQKGSCDIFCHIAGVLLAQISNPDNLQENLERWAENIIDAGYVSRHMHKNMKTLYDKTGNDCVSKRRHKGYTYGTASIIERLGISKDEMKHLAVFIDHEERLTRKREKRHTEGREERPMSKGQTREEWRSAVFQGSLKAEKPWEAMGISRRTYYRRKNGK